MVSLRTLASKNKYREYLRTMRSSGACFLCEKSPIRSFTHWKVVENSFPYDLIAKTHHMLVPLRHVTEDLLRSDEEEELRRLKKDFVNAEYDWIIEATSKMKSIPDHFHLHLLVGKERAGE